VGADAAREVLSACPVSSAFGAGGGGVMIGTGLGGGAVGNEDAGFAVDPGLRTAGFCASIGPCSVCEPEVASGVGRLQFSSDWAHTCPGKNAGASAKASASARALFIDL
jgi:hypothetical protein